MYMYDLNFLPFHWINWPCKICCIRPLWSLVLYSYWILICEKGLFWVFFYILRFVLDFELNKPWKKPKIWNNIFLVAIIILTWKIFRKILFFLIENPFWDVVLNFMPECLTRWVTVWYNIITLTPSNPKKHRHWYQNTYYMHIYLQ